MDYEEFNKEYKKFEMWNEEESKDDDFSQNTHDLLWGAAQPVPLNFFGGDDVIDFGSAKNTIKRTGFIPDDRVNSPSHYTSGRMEAIDIIEDAISTAPTPGKGLLQAQVLKYILRLWLKDSPVEDAKKAEWYLKRLIEQLE